MSLIHTPEHRTTRRSGRLARPTSAHEPTRHPAVCLISGFAFIAAMAMAVHYGFALLLG